MANLLNLKDERLKGDILEFIEAVPFVYNFIRADRKRAKNLTRDSKGRVIVNLTEPHILENMDFFREAANHYEKHGCYTFAFRNSNPDSDYKKYWDEQTRRCIEGYVRESDGEWITGEHYWYINFCPILKATTEEDPDYEASVLNLADDIQEATEAMRLEGFPEMWDGDYLYFHYRRQARANGKHCNVLKTRRRGYSFKGGAVLSRPYFMGRNQKMYALASEGDYLYKDGILNDKTWNVLNFIDNNTPWTQPRDYKDKDDHKRASYKDPITGTEKGRKNEIIGVTLNNNSQKARGKAGTEVLWEEFGNFPDGLTAWTIALGSMKQGRKVFGLMTSFGTGGTAGPAFEAMETLFYDPESYDVLALPNVFDRNASNQKCAFYVGEYLNREYCYDKDGNSDVIKALIEIMLEWRTKSPTAITQFKADYSITPQDAVMRVQGNIFPVPELKEHLAYISPRLKNYTSGHLIGNLVNTGQGIKFTPETNAVPIRDFPLKDNKKEGAIEIFQVPIKDSTGEIPSGRYIAGCDSYDQDDSTTDSLGSLLVLDLLTDEIVCEYTGRPSANDFYANVHKILEYYNATCNYENFNKGLFAYLLNKNAIYRLADTPRILKQMEMVRDLGMGNRAKGTPPSTAINAWGRSLSAQWMSNKATVQDLDEENNVTSSYLNLHKIRSVALIKEAIGWNHDGNFDRISALGMLMIYREDRIKYIEGMFDEPEPMDVNSYWVRNYGPAKVKVLQNLK